MKTHFKPGDIVRMNKEWAINIEKLLGEPPSEEEMTLKGMVYKIGDKYDISYGIGVKWENGFFTDCDPDTLEIV